MAIYHYLGNQMIFKYNSRKLALLNYSIILSNLFHEFGHIKQKHLKYETEKQQIYAEYRAELYSLQKIKKYYPRRVKDIINHVQEKLRNKKWCKDNPIYEQAYKKIKECRDGL